MRAISMFFILALLPVFVFAAQGRGLKAIGKIAHTPYLNGQYRALVIGNDAYKDPERIWKPLKTAVNDAEAVATVLRKQYGFNDVQLLINATRRQMIRAFNELAERSKKNDNVLIYYAGHGYLKEKSREGFWIPVDAEGRDDSTFIPNAVIKTKLTYIADQSRHVLLISDSCFSGALLREGNRGTSLDEKNDAYFSKVAKRKSVQILAAGGVEYVDDNYKRTGHSPFTYFLLKELEYNESRLLESTDLAQAVTRNVAINVQQTPERGVLQGAGHEGGEFFFMKNLPPPKPVAASPAPPTADSGVKPPKAALPLVAPALPALTSAAAAPSAAGVSLGWMTGGGLFALYAVQQYQESSDKNSQAQEAKNSDAGEALRLQEERDQAAVTALLSTAAAGAMIYLAFPDEAGGAGWRIIPTIAAAGGGSLARPGVMVNYRW